MNTITVLFFATLRDNAGTRQLELEVSETATIHELKSILVEKYPALGKVMDHCLASINHEYRFDETVIPDKAEVALFPPVSGG